MTNHDPNTTDFPGPREHPRLAQALRDLSSPAPGALDDRVLQPMRAPGRRRWLLGATVGVAAMLALGAGVILLMPQPTVGPRAGQQFAMDVPSRPTADAVTTRSRAALGMRFPSISRATPRHVRNARQHQSQPDGDPADGPPTVVPSASRRISDRRPPEPPGRPARRPTAGPLRRG